MLIFFIFIFIFYGALYYTIESFINGIKQIKFLSLWYKTPKMSLWGVCSMWMFLIGGLIGMTITILSIYLNSIWWVFAMPVITGFIIVGTELLFGLILNKLFKLNIWTYSAFKYNLFGQIELFHSLVWCFLGTAIWFIGRILYEYRC
jgi:hypothetical protein